MTEIFAEWNTFDSFIKDRFTNPSYNCLPSKDLAKIKPFTKEACNKLWDVFIGPDYKGWTSVTRDSGIGDELAIRFIPAIWDEPGHKKQKDRTRIILKNLIDQPKNRAVLVFWNKNTGVETTWGTFLKYWQDFCDPVDYEVTVILPDEKALSFIGCPEHFSVVNRYREFGLKKVEAGLEQDSE
jgi:hypothetical protein